MSEVTAKDLRAMLEKYFDYFDNTDWNPEPQKAFSAFDAMAEKAEAFDKLKERKGIRNSPYFNFNPKDIQEIKCRVEECYQDRIGGADERAEEEKRVGELLDVIEGLHIAAYQHEAENWKKLGHAIDNNKIRGFGFVIMNKGQQPEHMHCMTSIGLAEALKAVPE